MIELKDSTMDYGVTTVAESCLHPVPPVTADAGMIILTTPPPRDSIPFYNALKPEWRNW